MIASGPLDPRPRRQDLTSRECASILGGVLGGMVGIWPPDVVRSSVRAIAALAEQGMLAVDIAKAGQSPMALATCGPEGSGRLHAGQCLTLLAATWTTLEDSGQPGAARVALEWWATRDDAWAMITPPAEREP